jgi:hypothetical protein
MPKPQPDFDVMKMAADITKSALGTQGGWIANPEKAAAFLETVAYKITDLMFTQRP